VVEYLDPASTEVVGVAVNVVVCTSGLTNTEVTDVFDYWVFGFSAVERETVLEGIVTCPLISS
jgi:hypothetical protein